MRLTLEDLTKLMDEHGIKYTLNSPTPGVRFGDGPVIPYDELPLPSEYLGDLEWMAEYERQLLASLDEES